MKHLCILFIRLYQKYLSPLKKLTLNVENLSVLSIENQIYMKSFLNSQKEFSIIESFLNQYIRKVANVIERLQVSFYQLKEVHKVIMKCLLGNVCAC